LLLSSTGLAYRRCELAWVNGDQIGVNFLKTGDKEKDGTARRGRSLSAHYHRRLMDVMSDHCGLTLLGRIDRIWSAPPPYTGSIRECPVKAHSGRT